MPRKARGGKGWKEHQMKSQRVEPPVAYGTVTTYGSPSMSTTKQGMRIQHSELVGLINGTDSFATVVYAVNPAQQDVFPWLSTIAQNFESYRIKKLNLRYVPKVATSQPGNVILSAEYHSGEIQALLGFYAEESLASTPGAIETPAYQGTTFKLDPKRFQFQKYFTRTTAVRDHTLYDPAFFVIGTSGFGAGPFNPIGRLFVDYDIELMTPQFPSGTEDKGSSETTLCQLSAAQNVVVPNAISIHWNLPLYNPIAISMVPATGIWSMPPGVYQIDCQVIIDVATSAIGGVSRLQLLRNGAALLTNWSLVEASALSVAGVCKNYCRFTGIFENDLLSNSWEVYYVAVGLTPGNHQIQVAGASLSLCVA